MITAFFAPPQPGAGKTCVLSLIANAELKKIEKGKSKYKYVFTNYPCKGTFRIDIRDLSDFYVHDALILLDEVTMSLDNRQWKNTPRGLIDYIVTHRHVNCDIIYAVQQHDWSRAEKTLRENTVNLFYLSRSPLPFFRRWTHCKQIFRKLDINEHSSELVLGYRLSDWIDRLFNKSLYRRFYLPKAYDLFDSWDTYGLDKRPEIKLKHSMPEPPPAAGQPEGEEKKS